MKRTKLIIKLSLIAVGLIFNYNLQAEEIKGKIILENDTLDVTFKIPFKIFRNYPDYERLQKRVKYYDASGKKIVLKPSQAIEIRFNDGPQLIRMLTRSYKEPGLATKKKTLFLKLEVDGEIKMFSYYNSRPYSTGVSNASNSQVQGGGVHRFKIDLIQKESSALKRPKELTFRKDMLSFFDNCPELTQKIEDRSFRRSDLESIVQFYNVTCGK